jgi:hypothetical protein
MSEVVQSMAVDSMGAMMCFEITLGGLEMVGLGEGQRKSQEQVN